LISIACIITISLFGYASFVNTKDSIEKKYFTESELVLKHTVQEFEHQFESAENAIQQLAKSKEIRKAGSTASSNDTDGIVSLLGMIQQTVPNSEDIELGMESGRTYISSNMKVSSEYDPREQDWYELGKKHNGAVVWTEPYLDYHTQMIKTTAVLAVNNEAGQFMGVLAINFDVSTISQFISRSTIGEAGFVMLTGSSGIIIANKDDYMIGKPLFNKELEKMVQLTQQSQTAYALWERKYYLKSSAIDRNGMLVVTAIDKQEIHDKVWEVHLPVLLIGIFCLLIFSAIAYLAALRGIAPLEKLVSLMKLAENGDYNVYAEIKRYEEINSLSRGFNSMIESIKKRDHELTVSNIELKSAKEKLKHQYEELKESQEALKENEKKILRLASYDALTGLLNRRSLIELLTNVTNEKNQTGGSKAVIFIDLDNFKIINDTMGHSAGDQLIIEIARRFDSLAPIHEAAARIGGDEFIVLVDNITSMDEMEQVAKRILTVLETPVVINSMNHNVTGSIGIALYPDHGTSAEELLKNADMAMYGAKAQGKNCYKVFDESIQQDIKEKVTIEKGIRQALKDDEVHLNYQPLYNLSEERVSSIEALLRCSSPLLKGFSMMKIIKIAEETGLITSIDKWVLRKACLFAKQVNNYFEHEIKISVNISAAHIMQKDFVHNIKRIIEETEVNPRWIELEITETAVMEAFDLNKQKLDELKELELDLYLDDFGTGYSSLNYLNSLPIDYVKIDKTFVDSMLDSEKHSKVIKSIIDLAHNIGLKVVAEGIEEKRQLDLLKDYECDVLQGYYISKPLDSEKVLHFLTENIHSVNTSNLASRT
jgi:diguanylate cyclase (GGDEF)-like protein